MDGHTSPYGVGEEKLALKGQVSSLSALVGQNLESHLIQG